MNINIVDINARHRYRTIRLGNLYIMKRLVCCDCDCFLRNIGLFEEKDPEVSREDMVDSSDEE